MNPTAQVTPSAHVTLSGSATTTNKTNNGRNNNMKLKVNWKELARQLWAAVRPVSVETKVK